MQADEFYVTHMYVRACKSFKKKPNQTNKQNKTQPNRGALRQGGAEARTGTSRWPQTPAGRAGTGWAVLGASHLTLFRAFHIIQ